MRQHHRHCRPSNGQGEDLQYLHPSEEFTGPGVLRRLPRAMIDHSTAPSAQHLRVSAHHGLNAIRREALIRSSTKYSFLLFQELNLTFGGELISHPLNSLTSNGREGIA